MKNSIIVCMALIMSISAYSQTKVGLYGGINYSNVTMNSPSISSDSRSGFQAGVYLRTGNILYGQAGLEYISTQSYFTMDDPFENGTSDNLRWHMLNLPLYAGVNLIPVVDRVVNVRVFAGPTLSAILSVPVNNLSFTQDDFSKIRLDGAVGAGLDILMFSLDAGYNFGLSNVFSDTYLGKAHYAFVNLGLRF